MVENSWGKSWGNPQQVNLPGGSPRKTQLGGPGRPDIKRLYDVWRVWRLIAQLDKDKDNDGDGDDDDDDDDDDGGTNKLCLENMIMVNII